MEQSFKKITVLGGGTGTFVVLSGLKKYPIDLAAIVTMMDSGGSTGRLRDQLEVLPPGDLRQCLVALSEAPALWRKLFLYRFENGDLQGHNFGNIFLSALEKVSDNYDEVIEMASYVLKTKGQVFPVTYNKTNLCAEYESGAVIKGEGNIDEDNKEKSRIKRAFLEPDVEPCEQSVKRLQESDVIIISPGDLYTSIIPILLVKGIKETIQQSKAKIIYILNLMTKSGQTTGYTALDHIYDLTYYLGKTPDTVIVNNGEIPQNILQWYQSHNERLVKNDLFKSGFKGNIIEEDVVDSSKYIESKADVLTRSILRHSIEKLTLKLFDLIQKYA
ncbi:MAG: YvcK family protein [Candidatus Roizmanbacteria bacterium]|nr:MAG: YvcK family protein [Candidatus Roizmanbacteria bacterium]